MTKLQSRNSDSSLIKNNKPDFGYRFTVPITIYSGGGYFHSTSLMVKTNIEQTHVSRGMIKKQINSIARMKSPSLFLKAIDTRSEAEILNSCFNSNIDTVKNKGARLTTKLCNAVGKMNRWWIPYQLFQQQCDYCIGYAADKNEGSVANENNLYRKVSISLLHSPIQLPS